MSKPKHKHKWGKWYRDDYGPYRQCRDKDCDAEQELSIKEIARILNSWERRARYRRVGEVGRMNIDKPGQGTYRAVLYDHEATGESLYVKVHP